MTVQDALRGEGDAVTRRRAARPRRSKAAIEDAPPIGSVLFIAIIAGLLAAFLSWAYFATIEEVTRGEGRVIPFGKTQVVQAAERGVVEEINVRVGDHVSQGDVLVRLDSTPSSSDLGELKAESRALRAQVGRLEAEYRDGMEAVFTCPDDIRESAPAICTNEAGLLQVRRQSMDAKIQGLLEKAEQRERELAEMKGRVASLGESLAIAEDELEIMAPLAERNIVPRTELLRLRREVNDQRGEIASAQESIGRIEASLREANLQVEEQELLFRQSALTEMTGKLARLSVVQETVRGAEDRVRRTNVRAPVDGIVNAVHVNTIGSFVSAGAKLLDVVPIGDRLLVEARVRPSDIAFLRPGQAAKVKLSAYDFSIYGGLDGEVTHISADSVFDEETREPFYVVFVETELAHVERDGKTYPIMPGMVSQVDILTGEKTILDYLLKPINKAREEALRER